MSAERGLRVDHSTSYRWVEAYSPRLNKCCRCYLCPTSHSWRVDEFYLKVKSKGKGVYGAVEKYKDTLGFLLTAKWDAKAAKWFFRKRLNARNSTTPQVANTDKHKAYPPAVTAIQEDKRVPQSIELRQNKYLNKVIEQDHLFLQRLIKSDLGFKSFNKARKNIKAMMR